MVIERRARRIFLYAAAALAILFIVFVVAYARVFGPAGTDTTERDFVVAPGESIADIASRLEAEGLIRNEWAFRIAYVRESGIRQSRPGGYQIAPSMDTWTIATALGKSPYLAWVVVPPGLRKEQIGDLLASALSWTPAEKEEWIATDTDPSPSFKEGVYFPDTYLIPSDQAPAEVADRLRSRFEEAFAGDATLAAKKGIPWTTVVTLASLIEREAAGPDMSLISGILWNRLNRGMLLQVDATLQYAKGDEANGWWPAVTGEDKYIDSPYNTYAHAGLPPTPIAEPSLAALDAAVNPEATSCLYYLHDAKGQIHCSANYAGQLANVNTYLK